MDSINLSRLSMEEKKFKTAEEVRAELTQKMQILNLASDSQKPVLDLVMEENRQAWIRGKEYGWKKAWNWKRKKAEQGA